MERVFVLETGTYIRKSGPNLALVRDGKTVEEVALDGLRALTLVGYPTLTAAVLRELVSKRIETVILNPKGRFEARLVLDEHKHVERRRNQYAVLSDPERAGACARAIVRGKLETQARFLGKRATATANAALAASAARIRALQRSLDGAGADLDLIRGMEGHASNVYFQSFPGLVTNMDFEFNGRSRRPPLDPLNALLSFTYTLVTSEVTNAIQRVGLDPYLGSLHATAYGRPSLACDLVEEWRVLLVDRLVLGLVNRRAIKKDDFIFRQAPKGGYADEAEMRDKRPVEMGPGLRRTFLQAYEAWMNRQAHHPATGKNHTHRGLILEQARLFLAFVMGEAEAYTPYPWPGVR
ncbi:MAG: CRISPR-associated endonuclease Cas1 [Deltaproteobacteria bacterium]|nr:CRISPR-associated endonuclease Cas1 [Deltaproteobacteria bacterium]